MRTLPAIMASLLISQAALASDKLVIGPVAGWVHPLAIPAGPQKPDDAAIRILLLDEQYDLKPEGQSRYFQTAYQIQTAQGLAAGMVSIPWNPDLQTATIHKLLIHRGDQMIDVLNSGQKFTVVRRENNLDNAVLDGILTATIQPEGLQVGDIVDFAGTITSVDPTMRQHSEQAAAAWNNFPVVRAHMRAQWPINTPMRIRTTGGLTPLKPVRRESTASIELSMDNVAPVPAVKGAPMRFNYGRLVEMSDFGSWAEVAALLAPLYNKAALLPSPTGSLQTEVARIRTLSPDPVIRTEAALALVQDRVRYVFLGMNDGGLVPADAETTWSRRFGDCKGKTALLLSILRTLGVEADPVIASTKIGDGLDQRLPMIGLFDHVLVRATINGKVYWLDGTRSGDRKLASLEVPGFYWGLPLLKKGAVLIPVMPLPLEKPGLKITINIDASSGIATPAPAHIERLIQGDMAVVTNYQLVNLTIDARDRALREFWKGKYDFIDVKTTSATFDPDSRQLKLVMDGMARMEWNNGFYEADGVSIGYKADLKRPPGNNQSAPYAVTFPYFTEVTETIRLPRNSGTFSVYKPVDIDATVAGVAYRRQARVSDDTFTVTQSERSLSPEFAASLASAAETALRDLSKQTVYLQEPNKWEGAAKLNLVPVTADDFLNRGNAALERASFDDAIADFTKAIGLRPRDSMAFADRGVSYAWKGNLAAAKMDITQAFAIDANSAIAYHGSALIANKEGRTSDAIVALTKALEINPADGWALEKRAVFNAALGERDLAIADAVRASQLKPSTVELYLLRANLYRQKGQPALASKEADAVIAANGQNAYALVTGARIYGSLGKRDDASKAFDRALAIKPEAYIYINRANSRDRADRSGRLADFDAALKLDPASVEALTGKSFVESEMGDNEKALMTLGAALRGTPQSPAILAQRGIINLRAGRTAAASKDFSDARFMAVTAEDLNNLCWGKATAGVALNEALSECDAAIAKSPESFAIRDSRGFVLLRLGRNDDAMAEYKPVLASRPQMANSLYGRAIAEARKGDLVAAQRDRLAALQINPDIARIFDGYGVPFPIAESSSATRL